MTRWDCRPWIPNWRRPRRAVAWSRLRAWCSTVQLDRLEAPPATRADEDPDQDGIANEIPRSLVDYLEFYLLNYFKPATYKITHNVTKGRHLFDRIECSSCHIADMRIRRDRRVADVETVYDTERGLFNNLFATATPLFTPVSDGTAHPPVKQPKLEPFDVRNIFSDFKRHDLGPNFYERNYDGSIRREFLTTPLWGVGTTAPYGHDGRSINLTEVILRHGGEAQRSRNAFARLPEEQQSDIIEFLNSLVLFPPDDTASNLNPGDRKTRGISAVRAWKYPAAGAVQRSGGSRIEVILPPGCAQS